MSCQQTKEPFNYIEHNIKGAVIKSAVLCALSSLLFAGLNDIVFKKYSVKAQSRGMYICGIGVVWTFIQGMILILGKETIVYTPVTFIFGIIAGLSLCLSNIFLLESLKHLEISVGSTIYRLNTVGVIILSIMVLQESIGWMKGMGIVLGVMAVFLLYEPSKNQPRGNRLSIFFVFAIFASLFRAIYGVITKAGILNQADLQIMLVIISSCWIVGGILYAAIKEKVRRFDSRTSIYCVISGILIFLIVFFLTLGLKSGDASIVIPIANMSFLVAIVLAALLRMEYFTWKKGTALVMASAAIICFSTA